jgi:hypothetical protein
MRNAVTARCELVTVCPFDHRSASMTQQYPPPPQPPYGAPDPQQWQGYGHTPPPAPKKKRKWPWVVGGLFVLLFVVPALGNKSAPAPGTSTATPTRPAQTVAAPTPQQQAEQEAPAAAPSGPKTSFGDGTWVVGEDIVPGVYRTNGAQEGLFEYCQITTHSDTEAESNFLDWKNGNANEPIRVKISGKVKSVKATGCEDFVKVG